MADYKVQVRRLVGGTDPYRGDPRGGEEGDLDGADRRTGVSAFRRGIEKRPVQHSFVILPDMAIQLFIKKLSEEADTVTYGYGSGPDELEGQITLRKDTGKSADGTEPSGIELRAFHVVHRARRRSGRWPEHYNYVA
ncbi:hypothetical protein [Glycomyces tarimensis]